MTASGLARLAARLVVDVVSGVALLAHEGAVALVKMLPIPREFWASPDDLLAGAEIDAGGHDE